MITMCDDYFIFFSKGNVNPSSKKCDVSSKMIRSKQCPPSMMMMMIMKPLSSHRQLRPWKLNVPPLRCTIKNGKMDESGSKIIEKQFPTVSCYPNGWWMCRKIFSIAGSLSVAPKADEPCWLLTGAIPGHIPEMVIFYSSFNRAYQAAAAVTMSIPSLNLIVRLQRKIQCSIAYGWKRNVASTYWTYSSGMVVHSTAVIRNFVSSGSIIISTLITMITMNKW